MGDLPSMSSLSPSSLLAAPNHIAFERSIATLRVVRASMTSNATLGARRHSVLDGARFVALLPVTDTPQHLLAMAASLAAANDAEAMNALSLSTGSLPTSSQSSQTMSLSASPSSSSSSSSSSISASQQQANAAAALTSGDEESLKTALRRVEKCRDYIQFFLFVFVLK